ncbi:MAG: DUF4062 domain-containing protein [Acetobacter sp.]|nr:DUF4062 domain-containing protein [Bacteroides sp.]MCM1341605.1 DUF4062 domain-containing protein [Acetobacter sp.]MCM1434074.1 DUF4062 domain-containing protein [Clostridiales bacterium]
MERYYRVFISSVGKLLTKHRKILIDENWKNGFIPIAMEGFTGTLSERSIDVIIENLKKSDFAIIVISSLYGNVIENLNQNECVLKGFCDKCQENNGKCVISYTHFEYLYFKKNRILCYCIIDENYNDLIKISDNIKKNISGSDKQNQLINQATQDNNRIKEWISDVNTRFRYSYSSMEDFNKVLSQIQVNVVKEANRMNGLIPAKSSSDKLVNRKIFIEHHLLPHNATFYIKHIGL